MTTLLIVSSFLFGTLILDTLFLWLGARWTKAQKGTFRRSFLAVILIRVAMILVAITANEILASSTTNFILFAFVVVCDFLVFLLFSKWLVQVTRLGGFFSWLLSIIPKGLTLGFYFLVLKPFVFAPYIQTTNSCAPALLSWHRTATCSHCGGQVIVMAGDPEDPRMRNFDGLQEGICRNCLQTSLVESKSVETFQPDRFLVNKLLQPRRWDLIVLGIPQKHFILVAKRLIGLPGEEVSIREGSIWINGVKQTPPTEIAAIVYEVGQGGNFDREPGAENPTWKLGTDEFFVLGDFLNQSQDSRHFGAVPRANIEGVVSVCYWPMSRTKIWR